jgi:hypothetical protein
MPAANETMVSSACCMRVSKNDPSGKSDALSGTILIPDGAPPNRGFQAHSGMKWAII